MVRSLLESPTRLLHEFTGLTAAVDLSHMNGMQSQYLLCYLQESTRLPSLSFLGPGCLVTNLFLEIINHVASKTQWCLLSKRFAALVFKTRISQLSMQISFWSVVLHMLLWMPLLLKQPTNCTRIDIINGLLIQT